jgi:hypothetical protein
MLKMAIPWKVEDGFVPDRNVEPRPVRVPGGRPGGRAAAPSRATTSASAGTSRRRRGTGAAAA